MKAIGKYRRDFIAILVLGAIAGLVASVILPNERFRFPWEPSPFTLKAAFSTAQAVTPGQGQTVRVSGVRIGDISSVSLVGGQAIVTMAIDPAYKSLVHTDASALLRPKTGLKDMFIELKPGSHAAPVARQNWVLPIQNTLPDVNPDEIFSALDADTRDYLALLVNGAGEGLDNRGGDLQQVFARFEPTHRDLARVSTAVAQRSQYLRRLIDSLHVLNAELASKQGDLTGLVNSSSAVFRAFASEDKNISRAVSLFPGALRQTTTTLGQVQTFARVLGPTADNLRPAVRALTKANAQLIPFARSSTPIIAKQIRPFVRDARPLVRNLKPAAKNLAAATPSLTQSFEVLNSLFNLVGYNPVAGTGPYDGSKTPGYLFWLAWVNHQGANLFSTSDGNGPYRPITLGGTCSSLRAIIAGLPAGVQGLATFGLNLTPILTTPGICG